MRTSARWQSPACLPQPRQRLAAVLLLIISSVGSVSLVSSANSAVSATSSSMAHASEPPPLGRLFNTPQQRAQLDTQRSGTAPSVVPADAAPPLPPPLVLNGVLRPAHGNSTVWLNHEVLPNGRRTLGPDGKVTLTLHSGRRVTLKPGQRYIEASGEIRDVDP